MSGGVSDRGSINKLTLYRHGEEKNASLNQIVMPGDQINIAANINTKKQHKMIYKRYIK